MTAFVSRRGIYCLAKVIIAALGLERSLSGIAGVAIRGSQQALATREFQKTLQGRHASLNQQ